MHNSQLFGICHLERSVEDAKSKGLDLADIHHYPPPRRQIEQPRPTGEAALYLQMDGCAQRRLRRFHHSLVQGRMGVNGAGDLVGRDAQPFGERGFGQHLGDVGTDQMGADQPLLALPDAVKGKRPTLTSMPRSRACCSVRPTEATSGEVKMHEGMVE